MSGEAKQEQSTVRVTSLLVSHGTELCCKYAFLQSQTDNLVPVRMSKQKPRATEKAPCDFGTQLLSPRSLEMANKSPSIKAEAIKTSTGRKTLRLGLALRKV